MPAATAAPAFKDALFAVCQTLFAGDGVQVSFGHPGQSQVNDIVAVTRVRTQQEPVTLTPRRTREETLQADVVFSVYRGGGPEMEQVCSDRAYALLAELEEYVRFTDTTLGGVVRHCFLVETDSDGLTDDGFLANGRLIEVTATFEAVARITS